MKLRYKNLYKDKLSALGYTYNIMEGGYVSKDKATIIIDNRSPYIGQISAYSRKEHKHLDNLYKLMQFGAVTLDIKEEQTESDSPPVGSECFCGGTTFTAQQICRHDILVDGNNLFDSDQGVYDAETPYGPYSCKRCGAEFDELDELRQVQPKDRKTFCVNGELSIGDLVLSTDGDDFAYMVGTVVDIHHLGTAEHETENSEDEVFVDFTVYDYSENRIKEIEAMFTDLYQQPKKFDELPIDGPIMEPSTLIRITGIDESILAGILDGETKAAEFCSHIEPESSIAGELVMVLGLVQLECGLSTKQMAAITNMLPSNSSFMPIEFHENNTSAYGFVKDDYYEEHNYNAEAFRGLVLPVLDDILVSDTGYYTTPDNKRVFIGYF